MAAHTASSRLNIAQIEHGAVIPARSPGVMPEAAQATIDALGIRMTYIGWPGITQTRDGALLVSGSEHLLHVDPFGRDLVVRSEDGGRTWSEPATVIDSITDDRDMALTTLNDGTIVATWFSSDVWARPRPFPWMREEWEALRDQMGPDTLRAMHRGWLRRSTDGGRTWERLIHPTLVGQHAGPTPLHDGGLLYLGRYDLEDGSQMVATLSEDGGRTWRIISELPVGRFFDDVTQKYWSVLGENHVIEVKPGHLIAGFRCTPGAATPNVHLSHSHDGGYTWGEPVDSGVAGLPPYFLRLSSGPILCLFAQKGECVQGMFSYDEGATWDREHIFTLAKSPDPKGIDMGYPVAVEVAPGEVFCVYYFSPKLEAKGYGTLDASDFGIRSVRFKLA